MWIDVLFSVRKGGSGIVVIFGFVVRLVIRWGKFMKGGRRRERGMEEKREKGESTRVAVGVLECDGWFRA
jgi:hypothetical protein